MSKLTINKNIAEKYCVMDVIDSKLIAILEQDASRSSESIASELIISPSTVRRRIQNLIEQKLIRIVAATDASKIGFPVVCIMSFDVTNNKVREVTDKLSRNANIRWLVTTTGRFSIVCVARFPSTDDLSAFMHTIVASLPGIRGSETFICLSIEKGRWGARV